MTIAPCFEYTLFCIWWASIIIFLEKVVSSLVYFCGFSGLGTGCTFEVTAKKTKCQKMNVNLFTTKLGWIISRSCQGPKSLEANVLYNDSQHNISALQGKANKHDHEVSFLLPTFFMSHGSDKKISYCLTFLMSHFVVTKISYCPPSWWFIL